MRPLDSCRAAWLVSVLLAWLPPLVTWASPPASPTGPSASTTASSATETAGNDDEADAFLEQALDQERQRNWSAAIELYNRAVERWPGRPEFSHRKRLCESHYRLGRR